VNIPGYFNIHLYQQNIILHLREFMSNMITFLKSGSLCDGLVMLLKFPVFFKNSQYLIGAYSGTRSVIDLCDCYV
jgi:hypothetical protein